MIQTTTVLDVADNSGAKRVACIKVLGGTKRRYATIGDVIVVSVKEALVNAKVKKGDVARAVIVRTKREVKRPDGSYIKFDNNSAVMVSKEGEPFKQLESKDPVDLPVITGLHPENLQHDRARELERLVVQRGVRAASPRAEPRPRREQPGTSRRGSR